VQPILFVLAGFNPSSAASQALLAASGLLAHGHTVHVAGWDVDSLLAGQFAAAGAVLHDLGRSRVLEVERFRRLWKTTDAVSPTRIMTWGLPSTRLVACLPGRLSGQWIAAHALPVDPALVGRRRDLWMLRRASAVVVGTEAERQEAIRTGIAESKLKLIPPGMERKPDDAIPTSGAGAGRYLLSVGPLERDKALQNSIWALEILKYLFEDLRLLIVGDGPDRERLQDFARAIRTGDSTHFLGMQPDLAALYAGASVVWIPSRADRGVQVALEAMQAGRPVVATRQPRLAEIVVENETGFLVPVDDKVMLAKQTRKLLDDPKLAESMGAAGRRRALEHFSQETFVPKLLELLSS
jgi:glycosyltransferase involved in cell wall biosynthesis